MIYFYNIISDKMHERGQINYYIHYQKKMENILREVEKVEDWEKDKYTAKEISLIKNLLISLKKDLDWFDEEYY